jgi:hypothetical protein
MSTSTPALTSFTAGELSPRLAGRVDLSKYYSGCRTLLNFQVFPHGGATRRSGLRLVAEACDAFRKSRLIPFEFNTEQTYVLEFGHERMRVFTGSGLVLAGDGEPFELATPYAEADLAALDYAQSADQLFLVHRGYAPRVLTRSGHDAWSLAPIAFAPQTPTPTGLSAVLGGGSGSKRHAYRITAQGGLDESLASDEAAVNGPSDLADSDSYYVTLTWSAVEGAEHYYVYKEVNGLWAFLGRATDTTYRDDGGVEPDESSVILEARNPFSEEGAWPGSIAFWRERLFLAGTDNEPNSIWGSAVGSYFDFRVSPEEIDPTENESLEIRLSARQLNAIEWMVPRERLYVGTRGGTWTVTGAAGEILGPGNPQADQMTAWGASPARPLLVEESVLYVQRARRKIMEMAYSYESDSYPSLDMTLLAEHVTESGVTELAYAQAPDSIVYAARADGVLLGCTFMRAQEVVAFSRLVTAGVVESIAVAHDDEEGRDVLWAVVRRAVNGGEKRFVERLEPGFAGGVEDAFYVDCGVTFALGEPAKELSVPHLAGQNVAILADGAVMPERTVAPDGGLVLDRPARRIHVGLPYVSDLAPMPLEPGGPRGTSQTKRKLVTEVSVRFYETVGGKIGPDAEHLETVFSRTSADRMGEPVPPRSTDRRVSLSGGWDAGGRILIRQDQPLPMTVLLVIPTVAVND